MKIRITSGGIYGVAGEIAIGTEFIVKDAPAGWAGRYVVVTADPKPDAVAVVNPAPTAPTVATVQSAPSDPAKADKPRRGRPRKDAE